MLLKTDNIILEKAERWEWARPVFWTGGRNWKQKGDRLQLELREAREEQTLAGCWMLLSESVTVHMLTQNLQNIHLEEDCSSPELSQPMTNALLLILKPAEASVDSIT